MVPKTGNSQVETHFHADFIQCGLQDRVIGGLVDLRTQSWRIVLLQSGSARVFEGDGRHNVNAPALIWQPLSIDSRIRVRAGSVGAQLQLGDQSFSNAIGRKPESAEIRVMANDIVIMPLGDDPASLGDVARAFELILREARSHEPGAETIVEAQTRVMLVILWRHATRVSELAGARAVSSQVLQRFRHLLEVHFRERLGVAEYAVLLGTSPDRVHDICTRVLGRPPLRLIHERTIYEARVLLERSNRTVDQIAAHLGFRSAGQFNKFFKSATSETPGSYRRRARDGVETSGDGPAASFADWP